MVDHQFVDGTRLSNVVESLIFSSPEPLPSNRIAEIVEEADPQVEMTGERVTKLVDKLNSRYDENGMAFHIVKTGGGYTFATRDRFHQWLSVFQHENAYRKLSQSAIETLAIVAYKQPITKPEVDDIRGVNSGYILRQLLEKVLIKVSGRADAPGRPLVYKTTKHFLKHFGINSVDELPKPREIDEILEDEDMAEHRQFLYDYDYDMEELKEATNDHQDGEGNHQQKNNGQE